MKSPAFYKILAGVLALVLVAVGALLAVLISQTSREEDHFRKSEQDLSSQLAVVQSKLDKNEAFLNALENDPDFLDHLARQRLGYSRPDELILRFDVDPLTGAPTRIDNEVPQLPTPGPTQPAPPTRTPPATTSGNMTTLHR
jgi:cell division protein FtsB